MALRSVSDAVAGMKGDWLPTEPMVWYDEKSHTTHKGELEQKFVGLEMPKPCLFSLEVSMNTEGAVTVSPSQESIRSGIEAVISQSLRVVDIPERVFSHEELQVSLMRRTCGSTFTHLSRLFALLIFARFIRFTSWRSQRSQRRLQGRRSLSRT